MVEKLESDKQSAANGEAASDITSEFESASFEDDCKVKTIETGSPWTENAFL